MKRKKSERRAGMRIALGLKACCFVFGMGLLYSASVVPGDHIRGRRLKSRIVKSGALSH